MPKKNSVPYGWRSLQAVGTRMQGTRFIAFKVPLKGTINQRLTPTQKFTPKDLVTEIRLQGEELGLVVDLTNTNRYYEVKDLPKGVSYQKLPTAGLEVPDDDAILQFKKIVRKFLRQNQHNDKLVGVHCTTGLSRTGYLICRYLVDVDGWNPDVSMKAFSESRGLPMDGRVYVADLKIGKKRSNEGIDDCDPDELGGPGTLTQYDQPPRTEWGERPFHGSQAWNESEPRDLEDGKFMSHGHGERVNAFQDDVYQHDLKQKMLMEGYEVLNRPDHRQRSVHGSLSNEGNQEPRAKRRFEDENVHRLSQRSDPFSERGDFEAGRNRDFYDSQQGPRTHQDSLSLNLKHVEENSFRNYRPEQRARPFTAESRDFREESSRDAFDGPPGQRPRPHGHPSHDDFNAQMQFEENVFLNNRPGRLRPLEGEARDFPAERAGEVLENMPGQRPKPLTMNDFQAGRQTDDGLGKGSFFGRESRNLNIDAQIEESEFPNVVPGQRTRRFNPPHGRGFDDARQMEEFSERGYQQRPQPYGSQSQTCGFQNDGAMEGRAFSDRDLGQRQRPFHGPQSRDLETELQMGNYDISNSENQQRMRLPIGPSPHYKGEHEMEGADFNRRPRPFRDFTSHGMKPDLNLEEGGFSNSALGQRPRTFHDNQSHDLEVEMNRQGPRPFQGQLQSKFSSELFSESGPSYPDASKRMRLSDELNQGDNRFAPYASRIQHPPLSLGQMDNLRPYERSPLDRPVDSTLPSNSSVAFDYNYGVAEKQKYAPEGNFRERSGLPRRSRFN